MAFGALVGCNSLQRHVQDHLQQARAGGQESDSEGAGCAKDLLTMHDAIDESHGTKPKTAEGGLAHDAKPWSTAGLDKLVSTLRSIAFLADTQRKRQSVADGSRTAFNAQPDRVATIQGEFLEEACNAGALKEQLLELEVLVVELRIVVLVVLIMEVLEVQE